MDVKAHVTAIGPQALTDGDEMVILFNQTASEALREVAVIQEFVTPEDQAKITLAVNDRVTIDGHDYVISRVGKLVNDNLESIGHVTLVFGEAGPSGLQNALHFDNQGVKPAFKIGTEIIYHFAQAATKD
ncbi:MAG: PTS glucitol/sorbitol transporter subunit IIA [Lactobacillaceae bacterium]|jgi:PTS system glucitol/sorbitol-specific IIA component|nr:PTS glucitol/sorbitol transporter subunit IIA [Lactobacillaceae bacterium]